MLKKKDQNEFDQVYAMLKKTELYAMADQLKRLETENQLYEMSTLEVISSIVNEELITKTNKKASYLELPSVKFTIPISIKLNNSSF